LRLLLTHIQHRAAVHAVPAGGDTTAWLFKRERR
jgi:hypothetical protein